jgi:hypothetical protein
MIKLNGTVQKEFSFPADPLTTFNFFSDLNRVVHYLPHIELVEVYGPNQLRVLYSCVELGTYTISAFSDLVCTHDIDNLTIFVQPLKDKPPVEEEATLNTTKGYGYFASAAYLEAEGDHTHIEFHLKIVANLPRPRGMRMMPGRVVNRIAGVMSDSRVSEIAEGFMSNAVQEFTAVQKAQKLAPNK